ncbi:hypothetical protein FF38_00810 [Lucilia cuprina]|uniref:Uncharacterized protein n=1 Tax=Lucilia cuprina TaxID=7375 RepID=A0A0L0BUI0_LUCCU|nr:hypothetical protein FF38_00810 [Lucilia cuprina]
MITGFLWRCIKIGPADTHLRFLLNLLRRFFSSISSITIFTASASARSSPGVLNSNSHIMVWGLTVSLRLIGGRPPLPAACECNFSCCCCRFSWEGASSFKHISGLLSKEINSVAFDEGASQTPVLVEAELRKSIVPKITCVMDSILSLFTK